MQKSIDVDAQVSAFQQEAAISQETHMSRRIPVLLLASALAVLAPTEAFAQNQVLGASNPSAQASIMPAPPNPDAASLPGYKPGDRFYTVVQVNPYSEVARGFDCNWQPVMERCYGTPYLQRYLWEMQWQCRNGTQQLLPVWTGLSDQVPLPHLQPTSAPAPGSQPGQPPCLQSTIQVVPENSPGSQQQQTIPLAPPGSQPPVPQQGGQAVPGGAPPSGATIVPLGGNDAGATNTGNQGSRGNGNTDGINYGTEGNLALASTERRWGSRPVAFMQPAPGRRR